MLLEVTDGHPAGPFHRSGGGLLEAGNDLHQGGLAGAVPACQADALLTGDEERDLIQQDEAAKEQRYVVDGDHLTGFLKPQR